MKNRVVITGLGVVSPNGIGVEAFRQGIFSGKSGIGVITRFDPKGLKVSVAAEVKNFDPVLYMPIAVARKTDRFAQLGLAAGKMAISDSGLSSDQLKSAIVLIGSGLGGANFHEEMIVSLVESGDLKNASASAVPRITPNAVSAYIALQNGINGKNLVISTACSSGANAIAEAYRNIKYGLCNVAIAGGVEAPVSFVTTALYGAMMVLGSPNNENPETASRPFDKSRNGFVLGEGSACFVLESLESASKRNAKIYAELVGAGSNCGAYHMVAPNPSGEDAFLAMKEALDESGMTVKDIDFIHAHGTSTKYNDAAETKAIKILMKERAFKTPVSALKSMIGHTIGASGAIQAMACILSLNYEILSPTINLKNIDPECDLDYVPNASRSISAKFCLSNSFGFGSNNVVLALKKWESR